MQHAAKRAEQRLGFVPDFEKLVNIIRYGLATFVCFGPQARPIYDVPFVKPWVTDGSPKGRITIRVVVNPELTAVITVLPNEFRSEIFQHNEKRRKKAKARHQRELRNSEDEEIPVTPVGAS